MQNLVVRLREPERLVQLIESYRPDPSMGLVPATEWPGEPVYPTLLKISPLRQGIEEGADFPRYWASKRSGGGERLDYEWLLVAERHDTVDLRLARYLSRELATTVLAVQGCEGADTYGWCRYEKGELADRFFREMEERPVYRVDEELELRGIPYKLCRYRDCSGPGWRTVELGTHLPGW